MRVICAVVYAMLISIPAVYADVKAAPCEEILTEGTKLDRSVEEAALRFHKFFEDIKTQLFERDFFLETAKLALLAREHVLMLGPPGNAKSMGVDLIIDNIIDADTKESSTFKIQMTPETSLSETHGVIDYKKITEENIQTRKWEQGLLSAKLVFIDEFFDARANAIRNNLMALNEREHAQGRERIQGVTETGFAASNKYIHEVYEKAGDDGPKAIIDRFAFVAFVPGELAEVRSAIRLITEEGTKKLDKITFQDLDILRAKVKEVVVPEYVARMMTLVFMRMKAQAEALEESEKKRYLDQKKAGLTPLPPYRSTKYFSARTLRKAGKILRAIVVNDWLEQKGDRPLIATSHDLEKLMAFFTLNSMADEFLTSQEELAVNPYEKIQIMTVMKERNMFREIYQAMMTEVNAKTAILTEIEVEREAAATPELKKKLTEKMVAALMENSAVHVPADSIREMSESDIVADYMRVTLESWLRELIGKDYDTVIASKIAEVQKAREAKLAEERRIERERKQREVKEAREREARERREAAERETRARKLKEKTDQFNDPSRVRLITQVPQSYRGHAMYSLTSIGESLYALLKVEGHAFVEEILDLKKGVVQSRTSLGSLSGGNEQPRKFTRLSDGNYIMWMGGVGRLLTPKGLSTRKILFDNHEHQLVSDTAKNGEFWVIDYHQMLISRVDEKGVLIDDPLPLGEFKFAMSAGHSISHFQHDLKNQAQVFLSDEKKVAYVYGGQSQNYPRVYRLDLNTKNIEIVAAMDISKARHFRAKARHNHIGTTFALPQLSGMGFGDEVLADNKKVYHWHRFKHGGKEFTTGAMTLSATLLNSLNTEAWDPAPDLSYVLAYDQGMFGLYVAETGEFKPINLGGMEQGVQSVQFIDQDHILVGVNNQLYIYRLPTAEP